MTVRKLPKIKRFPEWTPASGPTAPELMREVKPKPERTLTYALTKPRHVEGYVTRTELAAECGMQAQLARLHLQRAGVKKPAEGWRWKVGSKGLWKARKALGLKP